MNTHVKNNIFVIILLLLAGACTTLTSDFPYIEKRLFAIFMILLEVLIVLVVAKRQKMTLKELGLRKPIKPVAWILGIGFSLLPMAVWIMLNGGNMTTMFPPKMTLSLCIAQTFFYFIVIAPNEEFIFRGFILENFNKRFSENVSILLTSLFFAFFHIYNGSLMNMLMAFIISVISCKVKLLPSNRSIVPCMIGHAVNDSLNQWIPYFLF